MTALEIASTTNIELDGERLSSLAQLLGVTRLSGLMDVLEARIKDICAGPFERAWDEDELLGRLHTVLGSCLSLGFLTLANDVRVLEVALKRGLEDPTASCLGPQAIGAGIRRLGSCLEASLALGRRIIGANPSS